MPANRNNNEQIGKAAHAGRAAMDEAADTARGVADQMAKAGEQATLASADVARRSAETARTIMSSGLNTAVQSLRRATDQFSEMLGFAGPQSEELARQSSENIEAVSQASTVLARGAQEISQEWLAAQDQFAKNMEALNRFARCRSLQDFVALQSEIMRDNLGQAVESSRRIAQVSVRVADEAARVIQARVDRNAVELERNAARARRAG